MQLVFAWETRSKQQLGVAAWTTVASLLCQIAAFALTSAAVAHAESAGHIYQFDHADLLRWHLALALALSAIVLAALAVRFSPSQTGSSLYAGLSVFYVLCLLAATFS